MTSALFLVGDISCDISSAAVSMAWVLLASSSRRRASSFSLINASSCSRKARFSSVSSGAATSSLIAGGGGGGGGLTGDSSSPSAPLILFKSLESNDDRPGESTTPSSSNRFRLRSALAGVPSSSASLSISSSASLVLPSLDDGDGSGAVWGVPLLRGRSEIRLPSPTVRFSVARVLRS